MKRFVAVAVGAMICLSAGTVQAQTAVQSPPAATGSKATPVTRALAERYFEVIHYDQLLNQMMQSLMPAMTEAMRKQNPAVTEAQGQVISEVAVEATQEMASRMKGPMIDAMADVFTEQELRDMVAFYETPTGQSMLAKSPQLTERMVKQLPQIMGDMQTTMRAKMCAKMDCNQAKTPNGKAGGT